MSDWLLILYKPSTGHSLGAIFLFFEFRKNVWVLSFFKLLDCRVWPHPSFHRRFDQLLVFRLTSNSIHTFYRTFPGDKCFVFFWISIFFFSFETLKLGNFERQFDTLVGVRWTSNFVQAFYRAFLGGKFFVFSNSPQLFELWCSQNFGL